MSIAETTVGKELVRRLVDDVVNAGDMSVLEEIYTPSMARAAARWIEPFRRSFPDFRMEIVQLVAEGDTVVAASAARARTSGAGAATSRPDGASNASTRSTSSSSATGGSRAPGVWKTP